MEARGATFYTACLISGSIEFLFLQRTMPMMSVPTKVSARVYFWSLFRIEEKCTSLLDNLP